MFWFVRGRLIMPRVPANRSIRFGAPHTTAQTSQPPAPARRTSSRLAAKSPATQEGGFRFLDLPVKLRVVCYQYLLPTEAEPHLLVYNPLVDAQKQTFLSLWRTCKTINNELPTISSLLSAGAIIPTVEVGRRIPSSTDSWEEQHSKRTSPTLWEPILKYLMPVLPEARYLHIRYPGLNGWEPWLEDWKNSDVAREAMHQWLWVHADDFSEIVDEVDEDGNEDADGHPSQGKTLLLDLEIANGSYIPYLYVSLLSQAISNLDAITLLEVELLEERSRTIAENAERERYPEYYERRNHEYYQSTLELLEEETQNLEKLKTMHEDFESSGFQLVSVDANRYGDFNGTICKWSADHRSTIRTYTVKMTEL